MEDKVIKTRVSKVWLGEDGIIRVVTFPNVDVTLEDITEINTHMKKIAKGKKLPVYNDIKGVKSITREARLFTSSEDSDQVSSAAALLIGSPVSKVIGNFFLGLNKSPYPTKLFTSKEKAVKWLKGFVEKNE